MSLSRAQILQAARIFALREAIVAGVKPLFADIEVKPHPGKLDISDVVAKDVFAPPSIAIATTRVKPEGRLSGADDFTVSVTAYVVCEDMMVAGARVERDEMAIAICEALLVALTNDDATRWGLEGVGPAEDAEAAPLFTAKSFTQGVVYYAVTWKQTLYAVAPANVGTELAL